MALPYMYEVTKGLGALIVKNKIFHKDGTFLNV